MLARSFLLAACILLPPGLVQAAGLVATRTLPAGTILSSSDVDVSDAVSSGLADPAQAVGKQARIIIYEGRPILSGSLRPASLIERNQIVQLAFQRGSLRIQAEGRALSAGAAGDIIRIMNAASKTIVLARVNPDGTLSVNQ